jgi:hypothetical protein
MQEPENPEPYPEPSEPQILAEEILARAEPAISNAENAGIGGRFSQQYSEAT